MPTLLPLIQYLFLILLRFGRYIISFLFFFFFFFKKKKKKKRKEKKVTLSLSLCARVFYPSTRVEAGLLGPCFKTGRMKPFRPLYGPKRSYKKKP